MFHYMIAAKFSFLDLKTEAFEMICKVFKSIDPVQLQRMDDKLMLDILKSDKVEATEETIFVKLREWIQGNEKERSKFAQPLTKHIQLHRITGKVSHFIYVVFGCHVIFPIFSNSLFFH